MQYRCCQRGRGKNLGRDDPSAPPPLQPPQDQVLGRTWGCLAAEGTSRAGLNRNTHQNGGLTDIRCRRQEQTQTPRRACLCHEAVAEAAAEGLRSSLNEKKRGDARSSAVSAEKHSHPGKITESASDLTHILVVSDVLRCDDGERRHNDPEPVLREPV